MDESDLVRARAALRVLQGLLTNEHSYSASKIWSETFIGCVEVTISHMEVRKNVLGSALAPEAAWEIMLALYASWYHNKRMSTTDVGYAAGMPPTTALRWLNVLADKEIICRESDIYDSRCTLIKLSKSGREMVESVIKAQFLLDMY